MDENLQEFFDSRGVQMRIDREAGILRGVKILGLQSRNNRLYSAGSAGPGGAALRGRQGQRQSSQRPPAGAARLPGPHGRDPRVQQRPAEGLFADFHFNPRHVLAEQLLWDAEHAAGERRAFPTTWKRGPCAAATRWWSRPSPAW